MEIDNRKSSCVRATQNNGAEAGPMLQDLDDART